MSSGSHAGRARGAAGDWSGLDVIVNRVRRRWESGDLLRAHANGEPFRPIEVPLRGPTAAQLLDRLDDARRWAAAVERGGGGGSNYDVEYRIVGGRETGRTRVPARAIVREPDQAWNLLGVGGSNGDAARFGRLLDEARDTPDARTWAIAHPIRALAAGAEWSGILAAREWLHAHRDSGRYLREIDAPGVDTKLVERHRSTLAGMLGVSAGSTAFVQQLGLAEKPTLVRLRFDPTLFGMPAGVTEGIFRFEELDRLDPPVERALIVENETSYLSVPVPVHGIVVWGSGYSADRPASLHWLAALARRGAVGYWGDLDTHGFAILDRVRAHLPGARSLLMDRATLLVHEARWGVEPSPTSAALPRLNDEERRLYEDLVGDRYRAAVRLEQERIDWQWVVNRLQSDG